jgi:hypothetical protein
MHPKHLTKVNQIEDHLSIITLEFKNKDYENEWRIN